jgi:hypothetical protein
MSDGVHFDGSGVTRYWSGFHVLPTAAAAREYLERFQNLDRKVIVEVSVKETRPKAHSRQPVLLAKFMKISTAQWEGRQRAKERGAVASRAG